MPVALMPRKFAIQAPRRASRPRTWKVRRWSKTACPGAEVEYPCECGNEAMLPTSGHPGSAIIAQLGFGGFVFDDPGHVPPPGWLPEEIECRRCGRVYEEEP